MGRHRADRRNPEKLPCKDIAQRLLNEEWYQGWTNRYIIGFQHPDGHLEISSGLG